MEGEFLVGKIRSEVDSNNREEIARRLELYASKIRRDSVEAATINIVTTQKSNKLVVEQITLGNPHNPTSANIGSRSLHTVMGVAPSELPEIYELFVANALPALRSEPQKLGLNTHPITPVKPALVLVGSNKVAKEK